MKYLLDTNIISDVVESRNSAAAARIKEQGNRASIVTSIVVVAELRFGYTKIGSRRLKEAYDVFLTSIPVEPWNAPCDRVYAEIRDQLERKGRPIGAMDMLIAAHALSIDAAIVTGNVKHFSQVPGLSVENWLRQ